jgi:hypothetical protein
MGDRTKIEDPDLARRLIVRRINHYFEVLKTYVRNDRDRFNTELARDPELRELFFVK